MIGYSWTLSVFWKQQHTEEFKYLQSLKFREACMSFRVLSSWEKRTNVKKLKTLIDKILLHNNNHLISFDCEKAFNVVFYNRIENLTFFVLYIGLWIHLSRNTLVKYWYQLKIYYGRIFFRKEEKLVAIYGFDTFSLQCAEFTSRKS